MSNGEMAYLALVLIVFGTFMGSLGFVSIWSRRPARAASIESHAAPAPSTKNREILPAASVPLVAAPPHAA